VNRLENAESQVRWSNGHRPEVAMFITRSPLTRVEYWSRRRGASAYGSPFTPARTDAAPRNVRLHFPMGHATVNGHGRLVLGVVVGAKDAAAVDADPDDSSWSIVPA
jgi:hypothetical protein